ncbi:MAG: enoyl-CoA hydratase/isomerase family protein [Alphaproteobacteria bacterium]|nr:enoyl-CoA hydratase/isomerase family protein [Alphaproteobacteria bacterium]
MKTERLRCELAEHVAVVTMEHPPVNAQDRQFHEDMIACFDRLSDTAEARVAVLTGAGKCFSAGADIKARAKERPPGETWAHNRRARECFQSIVDCKLPVIAALNGPALGAGLAVAASCDILIAADTCLMGLPEIDVGMMGGGRHAMRLFGHSTTRRLMLTGQRLSGSELHRLGVVEACVPLSELLDTATAMARAIAAKSPIASRMAKHALNSIEEMSLRDGYRFEQNMTAELARYADSGEAMRAFLEKRKPVFSGR